MTRTHWVELSDSSKLSAIGSPQNSILLLAVYEIARNDDEEVDGEMRYATVSMNHDSVHVAI